MEASTGKTVMGMSSLFLRYNRNGEDLNRNFPDAFEDNRASIQPETQAVMDWIKNETFVLSANLHGGALVASYTFDNGNPGKLLANSVLPQLTGFRNTGCTKAKFIRLPGKFLKLLSWDGQNFINPIKIHCLIWPFGRCLSCM